MKTEFILNEDREILGWVLDLKIPFEVEQVTHNQIKYYFDRVFQGKVETFSFVSISNNGMVNTEFDLGYLSDIVNWKNEKETSSVFKLFL